jgi:hypothetical protein
MICSCTLHLIAFISMIFLGAGGLILAVEKWHKECGRREQQHLRDAVEGEARP